MPPPIRLLRDSVDNVRHLRPTLSARELDREDRIIDSARVIMIHHGRAGLTMARFALAIRMPAATIRRHFPDIDSILAELLRRHLRDISSALGTIPFDHPTRQAAQRGAYIQATRTGFGAPTGIHALLLYERHALPPDLLDHIDQIRGGIGATLAGDCGDAALALLDTPTLTHAQIEAMLAALAAPKPAAKPLLAKVAHQPGSTELQKPCLPAVHDPAPPLIHARAGPSP
jgi:AcrR family transcriptional regulator